MSFENASDEFKRMNPDLFPGDPALPSKALTERVGMDGEEWKSDEDEFQEACESWLEARGYKRRTEDSIMSGPPEKGYFFHMSKLGAKKNPILLDVLILGVDGRFIEIELKREGGSVRAYQKVLVETFPPARLVRGFPAFIGEVLEWEGGK